MSQFFVFHMKEPTFALRQPKYSNQARALIDKFWGEDAHGLYGIFTDGEPYLVLSSSPIPGELMDLLKSHTSLQIHAATKKQEFSSPQALLLHLSSWLGME